MRLAPLVVLAALALPACGRRADPPAASTAPPAAPEAREEPSLAGRVLHRGPVPAVGEAPPPCSASPRLLRGEDGGVADVLVHLVGPPGPAPAELELSGDGCVFTPRAAAVPVGTVVVVANDGDGLQTFHLRRLDGGKELPEQNLALPPGAALLRYPLDRPGRYRVTDDGRPWMEAYLLVVEGGLTAVSDGDGRFALDVPAGEWTAELWHPALGLRREGVLVPEDGPGSLYVTWSEPGPDGAPR